MGPLTKIEIPPDLPWRTVWNALYPGIATGLFKSCHVSLKTKISGYSFSKNKAKKLSRFLFKLRIFWLKMDKWFLSDNEIGFTLMNSSIELYVVDKLFSAMISSK